MNFNVSTAVCRWLDRQHIAYEFFQTTDSTNDQARLNAMADPDCKVYLAHVQTKGRGRGQNTWSSSGEGGTLLATWSLHMAQPPGHLSGPLVGMSLFDSAKATWPDLALSLKPPNDLYLNDKKVAGLLLESLSMGQKHRLWAGLGLNVNAHPRELANAIHLGEALGGSVGLVDFEEFLGRWHNALLSARADLSRAQLSLHQKNKLTTALKAHPTLGAAINDVTVNGDIIYTDRVQKWSDL